MSNDCLFCKIAQGLLSTEFLVKTDQLVAFRDLNPVAPTHILVIPKKHIASLADLELEDRALMGEMMVAIRRLAEQLGLDEGFRVVVNTGPAAGQSVHHLHFHLLGGRSLQWPPG